jgi:hypothetical protein
MHKQITDVFLDGFTAHSAQEGEKVDVITRAVATSDSPTFFVYAEQIANLIFPKIGVPNDYVDRYLMVLHEDATAEVYLGDFRVEAQVRVTRPIEADELLRQNDLSSIEEIRFPDISIAKGDRVVYFARRGWRFGIAFDFTRQSDTAAIGALCAELQAKLILEDILQVTLAELARAQKTGFDAFIITEGKTDWRHLDCALREIGYERKLGYDTSDKDRGDVKLIDICQSLALEPRSRPVICVFDRDNPAILKQLAKADPDEQGFQNWGNNVYSFALPVPDHRKNYPNLSIEMYHTNEVLSRIAPDGRRICFDNEVKKELVQGKVLRTVLITPDPASETSKKVMGSDVDAIEDDLGRKVCLSKARFAEMVWSKLPPFTGVDFTAFRHITDLVERILLIATRKP